MMIIIIIIIDDDDDDKTRKVSGNGLKQLLINYLRGNDAFKKPACSGR